MLNYQTIEIDNFSGGLTDEYVGAPKEQFQRANNLFLTTLAKLATRDGSELDTNVLEARAKVSARIDLLLPSLHSTPLYKIAGGKFYYDNESTALTELQGPDATSLYNDIAVPSFAQWNNHLLIAGGLVAPVKVYIKGDAESGTPIRLRSAGLPKPSSGQTVAGGGGNYLYGFCFKYSYACKGRTFIDRSAFVTKQTAVGGSGATVSALPNFTNAVNEHWDTANIKVEIYRSKVNQSTLYYVGEVALGTTTYADATADGNLAVLAYIEGGNPDRDSPPECVFVHITENGVAYYGYCIDPESGEVIQNRVYQSLPGDIDSVPHTFFEDGFVGIVKGISSFRGTPIVFCDNTVYRLEGAFDALGAGSMRPRKIIDGVGALNHNGIVQTPEGVFFPGTDGFYWTDGFRTQKISDSFNQAYRTHFAGTAFLDQFKISGAYDPLKRQVWWTYKTSVNGVDFDGCYIFSLNFGIKLASSFSTIGGGNFVASSLLFSNGHMYRGHTNGYTFRHVEALRTDPKVDTLSPVANWGTSAIRYDYRSTYIDFGTSAFRKWVPGISVSLKMSTNVSVQVSTDRDAENSPKECREIKELSRAAWGEVGVLWGDPILYAKDQEIIERRVRIPTPGIRCIYRQFRVANSYTTISNSDILGLATVDPVGKTALLVNALTQNWPLDVMDYFLHFENDLYVRAFPITVRSDDTLTFSDPDGNSPPAGNYKWLLRGYAKGQVCTITALAPYFSPLTPSQRIFTETEAGGNA